MISPHLDPITLEAKKRDLAHHGYTIIPSVISKNLCHHLCTSIRDSLSTCAQEIGCPYDDYMRSASRWSDPSLVTHDCKEVLIPPLKDLLSLFLSHCTLVKLNIISKTSHSSGPIPLHQDISYSPQNPYQYSAWLALTDAPLESGPLEVLKASHQWPIRSAIDFWDPEYKETRILRNQKREKLPVVCGDLIIFDSRLWHGSGPTSITHERFAFVTRWVSQTYVPPFVPPIRPAPFGMWTCKDKAHEILSESWTHLFEDPPSSFESLLSLWEETLEKSIFPFIPRQQQALLDLRRVRILHEAHTLHNGGDAQGLLYKSLWISLLTPLKENLHEYANIEKPYRRPRVRSL